MTIGQRNNNPLNIRRGKTLWKGEVLPQRGQLPVGSGAIGELATEVGEGAGFCKFLTVEWGIRAAFRLLETYRKKYNAVCIQDIITRWAPPSENDTSGYIKAVCYLTGFGGQERLETAQLPKLVAAMARIESGMYLTATQLAEAYRMSKTS